MNEDAVNTFTPVGFPIDKKNRLALVKVKSISLSGPSRSERV